MPRIDFNLYNSDAAKWALQYAGWSVQLSDGVSIDDFRAKIANFIESGDSTVYDLAHEIESDFTLMKAPKDWKPDPEEVSSKYDVAVLAAISETGRAYFAGNVIIWQRSGVTKARWRTNNDDHVCNDCRALNNTVADLSEGWRHPQTGSSVYPPMHPGCRCFAAPVTDE